jgi:hypothetical protein
VSTNKNEPVRWIIVLAEPDLSSSEWEGKTPNEDHLQDYWYRGKIFFPKKEAEKYARSITDDMYVIRIEKYSKRTEKMKKST